MNQSKFRKCHKNNNLELKMKTLLKLYTFVLFETVLAVILF